MNNLCYFNENLPFSLHWIIMNLQKFTEFEIRNLFHKIFFDWDKQIRRDPSKIYEIKQKVSDSSFEPEHKNNNNLRGKYCSVCCFFPMRSLENHFTIYTSHNTWRWKGLNCTCDKFLYCVSRSFSFLLFIGLKKLLVEIILELKILNFGKIAK